jgi:hypothetical protein
VQERFGIHFGHSPHVDDNIGRRIQRLPRQMGELPVEMTHACRHLGLVLAAVKDSDRMAQ